ncbi:MAG TPA: 6-phosphogluconolactonase, partial [Candidatus Limnocylindrales bacterium]
MADVGEPRIDVRATPDDVSAAAAELIADALAAAVAARGRADWATTGGSTPVGIYRVLAVSPLRERVPWDRVHVWWGDDRFVPRDHPSSNVLPLDDILLEASAHSGESGTGDQSFDAADRPPGVRIPPANVHAMPMGAAIANEHDTAWVAREYQRALTDAMLPVGTNGVPSLDLVLVGVGPDGHVLSDFPGSTAFDRGDWVAPVPAPTHLDPKVPRVSQSPAFLEAAGAVLVVAFGAGKAEVLAWALGPERDPSR